MECSRGDLCIARLRVVRSDDVTRVGGDGMQYGCGLRVRTKYGFDGRLRQEHRRRRDVEIGRRRGRLHVFKSDDRGQRQSGRERLRCDDDVCRRLQFGCVRHVGVRYGRARKIVARLRRRRPGWNRKLRGHRRPRRLEVGAFRRRHLGPGWWRSHRWLRCRAHFTRYRFCNKRQRRYESRRRGRRLRRANVWDRLSERREYRQFRRCDARRFGHGRRHAAFAYAFCEWAPSRRFRQPPRAAERRRYGRSTARARRSVR